MVTRGSVVRAWHPEAKRAELLFEGAVLAMTQQGEGLFECFVPDALPPIAYRTRFHFGSVANATQSERDDPYRFPPTLGELDLHLSARARTGDSGRCSVRTVMLHRRRRAAFASRLGAERALA